MKYYEKMAKLGCFTKSDIVSMTGNEINAKNICNQYVKRGLIVRVKRDLYVAVDLATGQPAVNRFKIASMTSNDSTIAYHSAFEYYGYSNQVFYEMYIASETRFRDFEFDGYTFRRVQPRIQGHIERDYSGIAVTSLERTVIDSIALFEKIGGLEELLHCLELIPHLNEDELLKCLEEYGNKFLYQKAGYILSYFSDSLKISQEFINICLNHLPEGKSYLMHDYNNLSFNRKWNMYVPDFATMIYGGTEYDAIL